jgi:hypothetical protein
MSSKVSHTINNAENTASKPTINGAVVGSTPAQVDLLAKTHMPQDLATYAKARRKAASVPVHKPDSRVWVYVHPSPEWRIKRPVLADKVNQRTWVVSPDLYPEVMEDVKIKLLVTYATKQGAVCLWPISMPSASGRLDTYNESALNIVDEQAGRWIRVCTDEVEHNYYYNDMPPTAIEAPPPTWPESFSWVFNTAFKGRLIESIDHWALKQLREGVE